MNKNLISFYDYTGNWPRPYRENGWRVEQVDLRFGHDILEWEYKSKEPVGVILVAQPCTDYALSGAKHFERKRIDGTTAKSQLLVDRTKELLLFFKDLNERNGLPPPTYSIENPKTRIHNLNEWMGKPKLVFNPCDFAGYDPNPDDSRYNKETWLFGNFNIPERRYIKPFRHASPMWDRMSGKSEKDKGNRSTTPLGFAYAFYEFNNEKSIKQPQIFD